MTVFLTVTFSAPIPGCSIDSQTIGFLCPLHAENILEIFFIKSKANFERRLYD